jgi:hypothetical protein
VPDRIPESLNKTSYWYRTVFDRPRFLYKGRHTWLNFDGINYSAEVWVNGTRSAPCAAPSSAASSISRPSSSPAKRPPLAVLITPQPHPGDPHEHTIANGMVSNGGITAIDGPTFLSTIGWDWLPGIRDRDTGIWRRSSSLVHRPVVVKDPLVTTDLPLPKTDSADIAISDHARKHHRPAQKGVLKALRRRRLRKASRTRAALLADRLARPKDHPGAAHPNPKLWWPNGYGPQNLYTLHLSFEQAGTDRLRQPRRLLRRAQDHLQRPRLRKPDHLRQRRPRLHPRRRLGPRRSPQAHPARAPRSQIKMHAARQPEPHPQLGRPSTGEDFYELCDKYGILLWDEFFQPNPSDGPNPDDLPTYIANVRDKILRYRNHPSIAVWCARNEGFPPKEIDDQLRVLMAELEPRASTSPAPLGPRRQLRRPLLLAHAARVLRPSPRAFKTEIGSSSSIPTIESIQGMMPRRTGRPIDDDWAEHDLAHGAQPATPTPKTLADRYGKIANLADFVRKSQLANYEAFRAMYEGRNAKLFNPSTAVITWMSNPAQPSFVWQLYHYDLEPGPRWR